jgi:hypothetical protein
VPYRAARATLTFTTVSVGFPYLTVNPETVKWGQDVYHETRLLDEYGYPLAGELVQFQWYYGGAWRTVCEVSTDSSGYARCRWRVPYSTTVRIDALTTTIKFPCNTFKVRAYAPAFGVASPEKTVRVYSDTQIVAGTNKTTYAPGEDVIVSGRLQEITPAGPVGLANMTVTITWWDGTKTTVTTGSDGGFKASKKAPTAKGTYTITIEFAGVGFSYTPLALGFGIRDGGGGLSRLALAVASAGLLGLAYARRRGLI